MLYGVIALGVVLAGWSLLARRLDSIGIGAPLVLVVAGIVVGFPARNTLAATLSTSVAQSVAEVILAILLFVDATDLRGGLLGRDPRSALRLLLLALPLSLLASVVLGLWLLPGVSWAVLLVIACVVVPIDFAPAVAALRDPRIPERVRGNLNVEAGYNDGVVSPLFIFGLALAADGSHAETPFDALAAAVPQAVKAVVVGLAFGAAIALAGNAADRRNLATAQSRRVVVVVVPLIAYSVSVAWNGNGFVAAFISGIAYVALRRSETMRTELELLDDVGFLLTTAMWFVLGATTALAVSTGVPLGVIAFCLLALTAVRMGPVLLALIRSRLTWSERVLVGWLGPRGTTSIVFGLLAFNELKRGAEFDVLLVTVLVVLGSVLLHGVGTPVAARAVARRRSE